MWFFAHPSANRLVVRRLTAAVALLRPTNGVLTALSVGVGAVTTGAVGEPRSVLAAAVGAALIAGAGNAMNDVLDLAIDRRNRPDRPLPAGHLSPGVALLLASLCGTLGLLLAFVATPVAGAIAAGVMIGLAIYNWWGKRIGWPGNLLVGLLAGATFPFGAAAAGADPATAGRWWIPALFAALYHVGREIVKGVEDEEGDRLAGVATVALTRGRRAACRLASLPFALVSLLAPLPGLTGVYGAAYLAPVILLDVFLLDILRRLWPGLPPSANRLSPRLLGGMALGLLAILLGEARLQGSLP